MSKWTKEEILRRIAGGESPVDLGAAGGRATARRRQVKKSVYRRMAERHSEETIQNAWYNKED